MEQMNNDAENPQEEQDPSEEQDTASPLDEMISRVDSYIKNPSLVTPETLKALKMDLVDMKDYVDGPEEDPEEEAPLQDTPIVSKMKKYMGSAVVLLLLICGTLKAELNREGQPAPNSYISEAIYNSSNTAAFNNQNTSPGQEIRISTYPAQLHVVVVNGTGTISGFLEVFDSQQSTVTTLRKFAKIDTSRGNGDYVYDVYCASGITISKTGDADVTVVYRKK